MKIVLIIFISIVSIHASGQSHGYAGYIRIGTMEVPDAKNSFREIVPGIGGFTSNFYGIGGELEYSSNRKVFDAELMILSHGPVNSGDRYAEPFAGHVVVKAGYAVVSTRNVIIYPNAGIGLGSVLLNTYQKSEGIKNQLHTIYLMQPVFDFGVNGNVIVDRFKEDMPTGILPIGLRAGYRFSFASDDWRRLNGSGLNRANYSGSGWYLSIALGMGYITSNQNIHK